MLCVVAEALALPYGELLFAAAGEDWAAHWQEMHCKADMFWSLSTKTIVSSNRQRKNLGICVTLCRETDSLLFIRKDCCCLVLAP